MKILEDLVIKICALVTIPKTESAIRCCFPNKIRNPDQIAFFLIRFT